MSHWEFYAQHRVFTTASFLAIEIDCSFTDLTYSSKTDVLVTNGLTYPSSTHSIELTSTPEIEERGEYKPWRKRWRSQQGIHRTSPCPTPVMG